LRLSDEEENLSGKGGYRIKAAKAARKVVLLATGSEVSLAVECADQLEAAGIGADVVSMVCTELFDEQDAEYQAQCLGDNVLRVSIEAASTFGWQRYTGTDGLNIGIDSFGGSAPASDLFSHFGFNAEAIVPQIKKKLDV